MKQLIAILIIVIVMVGCVPSDNGVTGQPQVPVVVGNNSEGLLSMPQDGDNITTHIIPTSVTQDITFNIDTALDSTVLIFSTNQYEMDEAKDAFWYDVDSLKPVSTGQSPPLHWIDHQLKRVWRQGSGTIIDKRGYILTSRYAIEDCDEPCARSLSLAGSGAQLIYVFVPEDGVVKIEKGHEYVATVICRHPHDDLAVLKITPRSEELPCLSLGDSDILNRGDKVTAIGYPTDVLYLATDSSYKWKIGVMELECEPSATSGIVSSKTKIDTYPRNYTMDELNADYSVDILQTDADLTWGSSGGPLINVFGKVVGIIVAIVPKYYGDTGLRWAIVINEANDLIKAALARPIEGIPDGAFLSCTDSGYCCSVNSFLVRPERWCNTLCEIHYSNVQTARNKCCAKCESNTY